MKQKLILACFSIAPLFFDLILVGYRRIFSLLNGVPYPRFLDIKAKATFPNQPQKRYLTSNTLVLTHWLKFGGAEVFLEDLCRQGQANGKQVVVIPTDKTAEDSACLGLFLPEVRAAQFSSWSLPQKIRYLRDLIERFQIKDILIHHSEFAYKNIAALKGFNLPLTDVLHVIEPKHGGFVFKSISVGSSIDETIAISPSLASFIQYKCPQRKVHFLSLEYLSDDLEPAGETEIDPSRLKFVMLGRLDLQKRPYLVGEFARQLAQSLAQTQQDFVIEIYGDGLFRPLIERIASKNSRIVYKGHTNDRKKALECAFAIINFADHEGIPLIAYEAQKRGIRYYGFNVGQVGDLVSTRLVGVRLCPKSFSGLIIR